MSSTSSFHRASFPCSYFRKSIFIPADLPPTVAPYPYCGKEITSPDELVEVIPASGGLAAPEKKSEKKHILLESLNRYWTYRLKDFACLGNYVNLSVLPGSGIGKIFSALNWCRMDREKIMRTAIIESGWSEENTSNLKISKVICREFFSVGGEIGNPNTAVRKRPVPAGE